MPSLRQSLVVSISALAIAASGGCGKPQERPREDAAIAAAVEQARREDEEADRQMRERAMQDELARRDAEQAEIDAGLAQEDRRKAVMAQLEQRLRDELLEPASMQIRNQRLNPAGNALCAEVSAKNKKGIYVGFRRVVVSDAVISFDQDPDDAYRDPQHRFAAIANVTGCY
jgi:predicted transcriptional regulator